MKKKANKPDYYTWIMGAKSNLGLMTAKQKQQFKSKDDVELWAHNEYVRHFGQP